jgi:hypothetical protein
MGIDLMSVDRSSLQALGGKPRPANDSEVAAYMRWQRERRGLPAMEGMELEWRTYPGSRGQRLCIGATFGKKVQERREITRPRWEGETYFPGEYQTELWENGAYSLVMPGHDAHKQAVTFESLDDAGNVERAQTLPMEPKKGGVIWSRDDVRKAHGPVEKVRKPRASKAPIPVEATPIPVRAEAVAVDPVEICPPEAAGSDCAPCAVVECAEAPDALCEAVSATVEQSSEAEQLPADPVAALVARVEALEAIVATLSAETGRTPIPAVQDRPKRSAAHERAIRRAWAERKARRAAESLVRHVKAKRADAVQRAARYRIKYAQQAERAAWACAALDKAEQRRWDQWEKRRTNAERARRMIAAARHASTFERQRAAVLAAQLAKAQEDLAGAYSETELQAAVAVERERSASLRADLEAARAEGEGRADGAGVAAAQAAAQMARAIAAEEAVAAVRADLDKERAALAAVTARNARLLQSMADLTERVERAEAAIAA